MTIIDSLRQHLIDSGLVSGWKVQTVKWVDSGVATDKYVVIQSMTPGKAGLTRSAVYRVMVIPPTAAANQVGDVLSDSIVEYLRNNYTKDNVFLFDPFDPVTFVTTEGRNVWEINVAIAAD